MFIGQFEHNLEEKGRLAVPKKFRPDLGEGGVLTRGLDGCLFLFPERKWEEFMEKLKLVPLTRTDARGFSRHLTYQATEVDLDSQGRILLPEFLRHAAAIKKEVILAGALERIEIWDKENFTAYQEKIGRESLEMSERLAELGVI